MTVGVPSFRDPGELRLDRLLTQPFRNDRAAERSEAAARPRASSTADS